MVSFNAFRLSVASLIIATLTVLYLLSPLPFLTQTTVTIAALVILAVGLPTYLTLDTPSTATTHTANATLKTLIPLSALVAFSTFLPQNQLTQLITIRLLNYSLFLAFASTMLLVFTVAVWCFLISINYTINYNTSSQ